MGAASPVALDQKIQAAKASLQKANVRMDPYRFNQCADYLGNVCGWTLGYQRLKPFATTLGIFRWLRPTSGPHRLGVLRLLTGLWWAWSSYAVPLGRQDHASRLYLE